LGAVGELHARIRPRWAKRQQGLAFVRVISAGSRWTQDGALLIRAEAHRSQARNREEARERLADLIRRALVAPKKRIKTRPTLASKRRRLEGKTRRGQVKALRGSVEPD